MSEYIVKKGDSLSTIAKKQGTTVNNLVKLNNISNPDLIFPGQKIKLSSAPYTGVMSRTPAVKPVKKPSNPLTKTYTPKSVIESNIKFKDASKAPLVEKSSESSNTVVDKIKNTYENVKNSVGEKINEAESWIDLQYQNFKKDVPEPTKAVPVIKKEYDSDTIPIGFNERYAKLDPSWKAAKNDSLWSFDNVWDNSKGFNYIATPVIRNDKTEEYKNVRGVGQFLMDSDIVSPLDKRDKHHNYPKKDEDWVMMYKTLPNGKTNIKYDTYKNAKQNKEGYKYDYKVRSYKYSDIDWNNTVDSGYKLTSNMVTSKSTKSPISILSQPNNKDAYQRFAGGSVVFAFKEPSTGKDIRIDFTGSPNEIKSYAEFLNKKYKVNPDELEVLIHDAGSYSAKPKAKGNVLSTDQYKDYNTSIPRAGGAALLIPSEIEEYEYGGYIPSEPLDLTKKFSRDLQYEDEGYQYGGRLKKRISNQYPALENVYGDNLENLKIERDKKFKGIEYYDKDLPSNSDTYPMHPNPGSYGIRYNPKIIRKGSNKFEAIAGDLLHGMHQDENYQKLYNEFKDATLKTYASDIDYWWDKEEDKRDGKDFFIQNEIDARIRQLIQPHDKEHKIFMSEMSPEMIEKGTKILQYLKSNKMQYGGNILPYNTFSEYDKMYPEGGKVKHIMADLGYPNNTEFVQTNQNYWDTSSQQVLYPQSLEDFRYGQPMSQENSSTPPIGVPDFKYQQPLMNSGILGQSANNPDFKNQTSLINLGVKGQSASSKNSIKNLRGKEAAGLVPEGTTASTISSGVNSGMNMLSTALGTFAPPDSKLGKAMNKGNQFAQVAEPLGMLDMAVPGLGTGLVQGAKLVGAIIGGVQAKNEEVDVNRMKDINKFNAKYNNGNYDKLSEGNFLAKYGITTKDDTSSLEQEIFQDFDMFLTQGQIGRQSSNIKTKANDGINVEDPNKVYSSVPLEPTDLIGKRTRVTDFVDEYKKLDPIRKEKLANKHRGILWRRGEEEIENDPVNQQYNYVAKKLLETLPKGLGQKKQLAKYDSLTPRERQIINESMYANKFKKAEAYNANRELGKIAEKPLNEQISSESYREMAELYNKNGRLPFLPSVINPSPILGLGANALAAGIEGNYGEAALNSGMLMGLGYMGGGAYNTLSPVGGIERNIGEYLTTQTPLRNAYKINPWAFKPNPEAFYRQVDNVTYNEGLESGLIRGKQDIGYSDESAMKMFGDDAYYNKGRLYYKNEKDYPYLFEANLPEDRFIPKVNGRTRKYTTENTRVRVSKEPLPINDPNITIYKKDWLKGYKQIDVPKPAFKSEIDWARWNKEIPENKALMQEYNAIEQQTKADGTWMKNPDGSAFDGTPEQFVQQNSENFKNAFPEGFEVTYRGARGNSTFRGNLAKSDNKNVGSIFLGNKNSAVPKYGSLDRVVRPEELGDKLSSLPGYMQLAYKPSNNSINFSAKFANWDNISRESLPNSYKDMDVVSMIANDNPKIVTTDDISRYLQDKNIDYAAIENIMDGTFFGKEVIYNHKPNNYLKSLFYNNGMFDMTNPNIYKAVAPLTGTALGIGLLNKQNQSPEEELEYGGEINSQELINSIFQDFDNFLMQKK